MTVTYGSVCSGIEAASTAWHPLGWKALWLAEIEPFPSAVLKHHYPDTPNLGDMTTIAARVASDEVPAPDVLTGGTPCQDFSIAGLRKGLLGDRGQLTLSFCLLADAIDAARLARKQPPSIIVWENVPGVLSDKGNAFGCFLAGLAGEDAAFIPPGGKWTYAGRVLGPTRTVCWRVLDAQYFGVAQRRRRVWVVASARDGVDPATILFEREGVRRDTAPGREAREDVAGTLTRGLGERGAEDPERSLFVYGGNNTSGPIDVAPACNANRGCHNPGDFEAGALCVTGERTHALTAEGFDASEDGTGRGNPIVAVKTHRATSTEDAEIWRLNHPVAPTLTSRARDYDDGQTQVVIAFPEFMSGTAVASAEGVSCVLGAKNTTAIAFSAKDYGGDAGEVAPTMRSMGHADSHANGGGQLAVASTACVRRLTPTECERLQGFPDGYSLVPYRNKPAADGPRYKALGNSWAVPCAKWIGARIARALLDPQSLITGLPVPAESLIPPPHCRVVEYEGHVFLVDGKDAVHFEATPDGFDDKGQPVWASPESRAMAIQRAEALGRLITKAHNVPMGVRA